MRTCDDAKCLFDLQAIIVKMTKYDPIEDWSNVQMATTVLATQFKSLIVGNGIRQWHSNGFLSWFTGDGTRKLVSLYVSAKILLWNMCLN